MLEELLNLNQFELVLDDAENIKLVYLMNDAVESFFVFRNSKMTGTYQEEYEGELEYSFGKNETENVGYYFIVRQQDTVVSLFFEKLDFEINLYNYGSIGHFWVKGFEELRQIEYSIGILRDKYDYLGVNVCTPLEEKLALLADFPPFNHSCYPSVPKKYIVPRPNPWFPSQEAMEVMIEFAKEVSDKKLLRLLYWYQKHHSKLMTKIIARTLQNNKHEKLVLLIMKKIKEASAGYGKRDFGADFEKRYHYLLNKAKQKQGELKEKNIMSFIYIQEPFTVAKDMVDFKVYIMIWKKGIVRRKVQVEEIV